jgi:hypothetical protein
MAGPEAFRPSSLEHEQQMLASMADGSLDERDRAAVGAYVASSPDAQLRLARQRRVAMALRAGGPALSPEARAALDGVVDRAVQGRRRWPRTLGAAGARRRPWLAPGLAGCAAAIAAAIVLLVGGGATSPTITRTAQLAYSPSTGPAPAPDPANPTLLQISFQGITLPDYRREFAVTATGQRTDELGGRTLLTVYYRLPNETPMSYSIVSGTPLAVPSDAQLVVYRGVRIRGYRSGDLGIVTLVRNGRTCVLAGRTTVAQLVALAEAPLRAA